MSESPETSSGNEDLQFDHAEMTGAPAPSGLICTGCQQAISDIYYQVNGRVACASCRERLLAAWQDRAGALRTVKAIGAGLLASALGAAIYYGVAALTEHEYAIVALVVGLLVGGAVRWGSEGRGGWYYQLMAIVMTYVAIAASYSVFAVQAIIDHEHQKTHHSSIYQKSTEKTADESPADEGETDSKEHEPVKLSELLTSTIALLGILLALPVLSGFESPIGLVIVGFALYEAWKINKSPRLAVSGPYQAPAPSMSSAAQASYPAGRDV